MNPQLILAIITASGIVLSSALLPFQTSQINAGGPAIDVTVVNCRELNFQDTECDVTDPPALRGTAFCTWIISNTAVSLSY